MNTNESNYLNICLVGCISAGKSTILNAFFGQDYAQCKRKRTTMMPNKFIETDNKSLIDTQKTINDKISQVNEQIYNQTQNTKKQLNLNDYGGELKFHVESMEMNIKNNTKICMYDIPGLNDATTEKIYYDYLRNNFHKFNIILFVVNIESGLNTSDENKILNFLAENIKKHKIESNKNISLLTIVNKADDMQLESNGTLTVIGELGEMFKQTSDTIKQIFKNHKIESSSIGCIPICGLNANLYRMIKKYKDINMLSREHILRIGIDDEGGKFKRYSEQEQRRKVNDKIMDDIFVDSMIQMSGFSQIDTCLNKFIGSNGSTMISENILFDYSKTPNLSPDNIIQKLSQKINILLQIKNVNNQVYQTEMKKLIKDLNTNIFKVINKFSAPQLIIDYYNNDIIANITSNSVIHTEITPFFNTNTYPNYITDKILELVVAEYSNSAVSINKIFYFELFEKIGNLKEEIIDVLLDALMLNIRGTHTFAFDGPLEIEKIISIFEKIKKSANFIEFIRFFMSNMYTNLLTSEELITKKILFRTFGEIPMYEFINDLRTEKLKINTNKDTKMYCKGLSKEYQKENKLELYYITKCREFGDDANFINHEKIIFIKFN